MNISADYIDVSINLGSVQNNYKRLLGLVNENTKVSAVIKSDAYGLGATEIAKALCEVGCKNFWVADILEGIEFRKHVNNDANVYLLYGYHDKSNFQILRDLKLTPVINDISELEEIDSDIPCVLHIDTGLTRLGIRPQHFVRAVELVSCKNVIAIMSHLACSDNKDSAYNIYQKSIFDRFLEKAKSIKDVRSCLSATGGITLGEGFEYDMVRVGAYIYGVNVGSLPKPENVVSIKARVVQTYGVQTGTKVGYDSTYETSKPSEFAVIPIGYAHGIFRSLSNSGKIVFEKYGNTYFAPIVGKVSMDLLVCDISNIPNVSKGEDVWILCNSYTVNEMAKDAKTIAYEILTNLNLCSNKVRVTYI